MNTGTPHMTAQRLAAHGLSGLFVQCDRTLKYHSDGYTEADITVQVLRDADWLDLGVWALSQPLSGSVQRLRSRRRCWRRLMRGC